MGYRLDEVDRRIIYRLMEDARETSAPDVAGEVNVSAGTIRNRINRLEDRGIITGYHASIDFEQADGKLTNLFVCSAPVSDRETLAKQVLQIPGVVDVRELVTGQRNLHVTTVGNDMDDMTRIARAIEALGLEIEHEDLVHRQYHQPYHQFGPEESPQFSSLTDFISLTGGAEVIELSVAPDAPVAGKTLEEANSEGLIGDDVLIIAIERDGEIITPRGHTTIEMDDLITVFSQRGREDEIVGSFTDSLAP